MVGLSGDEFSLKESVDASEPFVVPALYHGKGENRCRKNSVDLLSLVKESKSFRRSVFSASEIIVEIQFGEGGADSKIFVGELLAAYLKYARSLGFRSELVDSSDGHMMAKIAGSGVGQAFRYEPGKHCVQRIPPTESKGRKQTSMVSVAVMPILQHQSNQIRAADLRVEAVNLGGKGGQHQNRTLSGCRVTHVPTGIQACINGRSYHANEREARSIVAAKVAEGERLASQRQHDARRKTQMAGGGRSNKVRTYNFIESRVVDHRLGTKTKNVKGVMKGQFDLILP